MSIHFFSYPFSCQFDSFSDSIIFFACFTFNFHMSNRLNSNPIRSILQFILSIIHEFIACPNRFSFFNLISFFAFYLFLLLWWSNMIIFARVQWFHDVMKFEQIFRHQIENENCWKYKSIICRYAVIIRAIACWINRNSDKFHVNFQFFV